MVDTHSQVKAAEIIDMFEDELRTAMALSATFQVYVMVGWLPPANSHTDLVEVYERTFGLPADPVLKTRTRHLLNQVASCTQQKKPVVIDELLINHNQYFGCAVVDDVVVVCISDTGMFTDDFCARLAENIRDESVRALAS